MFLKLDFHIIVRARRETKLCLGTPLRWCVTVDSFYFNRVDRKSFRWKKSLFCIYNLWRIENPYLEKKRSFIQKKNQNQSTILSRSWVTVKYIWCFPAWLSYSYWYFMLCDNSKIIYVDVVLFCFYSCRVFSYKGWANDWLSSSITTRCESVLRKWTQQSSSPTSSSRTNVVFLNLNEYE